MAVSTITYTRVHFTAFIVLCCVTSIAQVSGDSNVANHSLYCNGRWCVQNEEYCDKIENKCRTCQYTQNKCTPHLDCLSYCIEKGIDQGMHDRQDSIPEETSASTWAIPMFILLLVLFIISFGFNISLAVRFYRQRHAASRSGMGLDTVTNDDHKKISLTDVMRVKDDTENKEDCKGVQEQGSDSNEVVTESDDTEVKKPDKDEKIPFLEVVKKSHKDVEKVFDDVMTENDDTDVKNPY